MFDKPLMIHITNEELTLRTKVSTTYNCTQVKEMSRTPILFKLPRSHTLLNDPVSLVTANPGQETKRDNKTKQQPAQNQNTDFQRRQEVRLKIWNNDGTYTER